jgi:hypothetical protein
VLASVATTELPTIEQAFPVTVNLTSEVVEPPRATNGIDLNATEVTVVLSITSGFWLIFAVANAKLKFAVLDKTLSVPDVAF